MNLDEAISKIETIVSRRDDPIKVKWESGFNGTPLSVIHPIKKIYTYGPSTYLENPDEIEVLVIVERSDFTGEFFFDRDRNAPTDHLRFKDFRRLVKQMLLRRMKNVNMEVDLELNSTRTTYSPYNAYSAQINNRQMILVWSAEKPEVRRNLEAGRKYIDVKPELEYLNKKVKEAKTREYFDSTIVRMWFENHMMSDNDKIRILDTRFTKKELPEIREYIKDIKDDGIYSYTHAASIIEKFIKIKEQKGSKELFFKLGWSERFRSTWNAETKLY